MLENNPSCFTKNCTFPMFTFLDFCFNCIDVTQFLQQNSSCTQKINDVIYDYYCTYRLSLFSSSQNYAYFDDDENLSKNSNFALSWAAGNMNEISHIPDYVQYTPGF